MPHRKIELVVSITVAAAALGALGGGLLNEKLGRKKAIMVASAISCVGAVVMEGAPLSSWGWSLLVLASALVSESMDMCHWNGNCGGIWELTLVGCT